MNILIDARMYGLEHAGIGRYTAGLVDTLVSTDQDNHYHLLLSSKYFQELEAPANVTKHRVDIRHYTLKEQLVLPRIFASIKADVYHIPHFNVPLLFRMPFVVTIHDLLWHQIKGPSVTTLSPLMYRLKYQGYLATVSHAIKHSQAILVPSRFVKQQVQQQYPTINPKKITVTYEGVTTASIPSKVPKPDTLVPSLPSKASYFVYTGSCYPHKNVPMLIKALKILNKQRDRRVYLVIIASRDIFVQNLKRFVQKEGMSKLVIFAGFMPDPQVVALYQNAVALVHPSVSEGFGLTGLEAMKLGLPVLAADASALPEIYADSALFFNPHNPQDLADKMNSLLSQANTRASLIQKGKQRANFFSWEKMAKQSLAVYQQVATA